MNMQIAGARKNGDMEQSEQTPMTLFHTLFSPNWAADLRIYGVVNKQNKESTTLSKVILRRIEQMPKTPNHDI